MAVGFGVAVPKYERTIRQGKARQKREQYKRTRTTREYVFGRERGICRVCRCRRAETMHELIPRSRRGKVCASNSVAVCGDGVRGCHGFCQRYEILYEHEGMGAEGPLTFRAETQAAADWMRVALGQAVLSVPGSMALEVG